MDSHDPSDDADREQYHGTVPVPRGVDWSSPVIRRLLVALVLCVVMAVGCWVIGPRLGVDLPPIVPLVGFAVIAAGTLLGLWEAGSTAGKGGDSTDGTSE